MPAPKGTRLTITEQEIIKSLLARGLTATAIGKQIKRDAKTVLSFARLPEVKAEVEEEQQELSAAFEGLARRMVESITDDDISSISAYQRTLAAAVAVDKQRLLSGQSTSNVSVLTKAVEDAWNE